MKMKYSLVAAATLMSLATVSQAVEMGGYLRVGPGQKSPNRCFGGPLEGGTYRLGNECNTYFEFELSQRGKAGNIDYKVLLMTNYYKGGASDPDNNKLGINQIYVEGKGLDVAPNQTFWVGKRFYGRTDVHMVDTFFFNLTGTGAGVDGIDVGVGSLNLAVFRDDGDGTNDDLPDFGNDRRTNKGTRLNADLTGIASNPGGKLRLVATATDYSGPNGKGGFAIGAQHNQQGVFGGENTLWLQYAQGSAYLNGGFGGGTDDSDMKRWRLVESITWVNGPLTAQTLALFGQQGRSGDKQKFATLGGRVAYAITNNFKIQGELGWSHMKPDNGNKQQITKFTIAPTLTAGPNYYDRPEFRLYYTAAKWNDGYRDANLGTYGNKKSGHAVGIQVETWF